jgi:DNA-directed RNA polymerase specialized sigma24 family protein
MLEDKLVLWKLRRGNPEALQHIYEKYRNGLLGLATALAGDRTLGEDVVHDVFVTFAGHATKPAANSSSKPARR